MADPFSSYSATPAAFVTQGRIVTPGSSDLDPIAKSITALTTGDVTIVPVENANGVTLSFTGVPAGWVCPYRVRRVTAATATIATIEG